jgi:hypothetical protein
MKNLWMKRIGKTLVPIDEHTDERMADIKEGIRLKVSCVYPRDVEQHNRFFAMLRFAFDYWEPPAMQIGNMSAVKEFETFRENVIVMAGFRYPVINTDGSFTWKAKSISFDDMAPEDFNKCYQACFSVLYDMVLSSVEGMSLHEINMALNKITKFEEKHRA